MTERHGVDAKPGAPKVEGCERSFTLTAGPAAGHYDLAQLKASLDSRQGPARYNQLQAVMAMKGLVTDHSEVQKSDSVERFEIGLP
eukprot:CAMPEP_0114666554 /NCGR_PEP_ID=MMETSP0191-20121206/32755_1 /TAXON_ID=126664 /ORGANISM="Sorites sp." /LENGTH=85 /DNA_ID=CAMNT_0001914475 /DNA_START=18 /DNA_END=275 /DNA_ORIENTATION=+